MSAMAFNLYSQSKYDGVLGCAFGQSSAVVKQYLQQEWDYHAGSSGREWNWADTQWGTKPKSRTSRYLAAATETLKRNAKILVLSVAAFTMASVVADNFHISFDSLGQQSTPTAVTIQQAPTAAAATIAFIGNGHFFTRTALGNKNGPTLHVQAASLFPAAPATLVKRSFGDLENTTANDGARIATDKKAESSPKASNRDIQGIDDAVYDLDKKSTATPETKKAARALSAIALDAIEDGHLNPSSPAVKQAYETAAYLALYPKIGAEPNAETKPDLPTAYKYAKLAGKGGVKFLKYMNNTLGFTPR